MQIRSAIETYQLEACYPIVSQLRPHLEQRAFVEQVLKQAEAGFRMNYIEQDNTVVAVIGYRVTHNLAWGKHIYVDDLVVGNNVRSGGYGKALIDHIKKLAKQQGCNEVHLDSGVQRFQAHRFYLREGFVISSHHFTYTFA